MARKIKKRQPPPTQPSTPPTVYQCEAEVIEGLEQIARSEIQGRLKERVTFGKDWNPSAGVVVFSYTGGLRALNILNTVQAVYIVRNIKVPRPRALLGDQYFRRLITHLSFITEAMPNTFQTVAIGAAGADSPDVVRLKTTIAEALGLEAAEDEGDLLVRLRRPYATDVVDRDKEIGWDVLVRTSSRPLGTRKWRVINMEGALNATVASAMALMTAPHPQDYFLNLMCGSGSLMIERQACGTARRIVGCDISAMARQIAQQNIVAAGYDELMTVYDWDARSIPLGDGGVDALVADLPFGQLVGSHAENMKLYPAVMQEAARVAKMGAPFVLITHEVSLMESILETSTLWKTVEVIKINLRGLHPRIFVLQRT